MGRKLKPMDSDKYQTQIRKAGVGAPVPVSCRSTHEHEQIRKDVRECARRHGLGKVSVDYYGGDHAFILCFPPAEPVMPPKPSVRWNGAEIKARYRNYIPLKERAEA